MNVIELKMNLIFPEIKNDLVLKLSELEQKGYFDERQVINGLTVIKRQGGISRSNFSIQLNAEQFDLSNYLRERFRFYGDLFDVILMDEIERNKDNYNSPSIDGFDVLEKLSSVSEIDKMIEKLRLVKDRIEKEVVVK